MATTIWPVRVNHINVVVEDFDASVAYLKRVYDGEFLLDLPGPAWHACLVATGQTIFELFEPAGYLLNARYGPHYVGIEYQADMEEARRAVVERGIRIVRDTPHAFHTHPADCFGIAFEFYDGAFHDMEWALLDGALMKPVSWWRDDHPLGLTGLAGYTIAVRDGLAAQAFFESFVGATLIDGGGDRRAAGAHAIRMQVADSWVELLSPRGDGAILDHLHRYGEGIYSTVFGVRDADGVRGHLAGKAVTLVPGSAPGRLAAPADNALGVIIEFDA